jgi:hypothetical protein
VEVQALICVRFALFILVISGRFLTGSAHGSGCERIAAQGARTAPSGGGRVGGQGVAQTLHATALRAYDQIIGPGVGRCGGGQVPDKAPYGGRPGPVRPRPSGARAGWNAQSSATGTASPLGIASQGTNRDESPLQTPTCRPPSGNWTASRPEGRTCRLDCGYDSTVTRQLLDELGFKGEIARKASHPDPGRQPLGRQAHACADERLRQATLLHRTPEP